MKVLLLICLVILLLGSCHLEELFNLEGSLSLSIITEIRQDVIYPGMAVEPVLFIISGTGPRDVKFAPLEITESGLIIDQLKSGRWQFSIKSYNNLGQRLGAGDLAIEIPVDDVITGEVRMQQRQDATGCLQIGISYPVNSVAAFQVVGVLKDENSVQIIKEFSLNSSYGYGGNTFYHVDYQIDNLVPQYYSLSVTIKDDNNILLSSSLPINIIAAEVTECRIIGFYQNSEPEGSPVFSVMSNQLQLRIDGLENVLVYNQSMTLTADITLKYGLVTGSYL